MKTFKELQTHCNLPGEHLFQYMQIQAYCKGQKWQPSLSFMTFFIDALLNQNKNSISNIYPHIQSLFLPTIEDITIKNRNNDLPLNGLTDLILDRYLKMNKLTIAETWKKTQYKILHRGYSTGFYYKEESIDIKDTKDAKELGKKSDTTKPKDMKASVAPTDSADPK